MKTTKKLASLFLALLMALSCMAMPAMAAGDEGIMPLGPMMRCGSCGQTVELSLRDSHVTCYCGSLPNKHVKTTVYASYSCSCGNSDSFVYSVRCH